MFVVLPKNWCKDRFFVWWIVGLLVFGAVQIWLYRVRQFKEAKEQAAFNQVITNRLHELMKAADEVAKKNRH